MDERQELIDEIKQITTQYQDEVSRGRKAWPKAIKTRVAELCEKGMPAKEIASRTALPYYTVLRWRPKEMRGKPRGKYGRAASKFKELAIVASKPILATVTVAQKPSKTETHRAAKILATVTVTTPQGFKVELANTDQAAQFLRELMKA